MATVIYFTSGVEALVTESATEIERLIEEAGPIASLTLGSGDPVFVRVDRLTHWHEDTAQMEGASGGQSEERPRAKPRYGRGLPRTG